MSKADFVRLVQITASERFNVVLGPPEDEVTVREALLERDAASLAATLRRILDSCIDQTIENTRRRCEGEVLAARDAAAEKSAQAATDAKEAAIDAVEECIKSRSAAVPKKPFSKCCRSTANDVKAAVRSALG